MLKNYFKQYTRKKDNSRLKKSNENLHYFNSEKLFYILLCVYIVCLDHSKLMYSKVKNRFNIFNLNYQISSFLANLKKKCFNTNKV